MSHVVSVGVGGTGCIGVFPGVTATRGESGELYIPPAPAPPQKGFGKFTRKMSSPKCANRIHSPPLSVFYDPFFAEVAVEPGISLSRSSPPSLSATALTVPIASSRTLSRLRAACYPTGICKLNCVTCLPSYQSILMH
jgi:hypothetical protein